MARTKSTARTTTTKAQTTAHRMADAFDRNVAIVRADLAKPAHQSTTKKVASVSAVAGVGFALGAWLA